jgi:hypothetical protein
VQALGGVKILVRGPRTVRAVDVEAGVDVAVSAGVVNAVGEVGDVDGMVDVGEMDVIVDAGAADVLAELVGLTIDVTAGIDPVMLCGVASHPGFHGTVLRWD